MATNGNGNGTTLRWVVTSLLSVILLLLSLFVTINGARVTLLEQHHTEMMLRDASVLQRISALEAEVRWLREQEDRRK